jgi:hypothetical protein
LVTCFARLANFSVLRVSSKSVAAALAVAMIAIRLAAIGSKNRITEGREAYAWPERDGSRMRVSLLSR